LIKPTDEQRRTFSGISPTVKLIVVGGVDGAAAVRAGEVILRAGRIGSGKSFGQLDVSTNERMRL
jgi:hypothetical protein